MHWRFWWQLRWYAGAGHRFLIFPGRHRQRQALSITLHWLMRVERCKVPVPGAMHKPRRALCLTGLQPPGRISRHAAWAPWPGVLTGGPVLFGNWNERYTAPTTTAGAVKRCGRLICMGCGQRRNRQIPDKRATALPLSIRTGIKESADANLRARLIFQRMRKPASY